MVKHNLRAIWSQKIHFNAGCKAGHMHSKVANDSQPSHHHWDEWSLCGTQTFTHTHPQFSEADTSIRLIRHAYRMVYSSSLKQHCWSLAIFLCYCITNSLQRWRRESSMIGCTFRQKHTAELQRGRSGDGGQSREARKKETVTPLCVFLYSTALQAVDIINISVVFLQRRLLSWLGVLIASVALRHWKGLQEENNKHHHNAGSFWNYNMLLSLSLEALPGKWSAPFGFR